MFEYMSIGLPSISTDSLSCFINNKVNHAHALKPGMVASFPILGFPYEKGAVSLMDGGPEGGSKRFGEGLILRGSRTAKRSSAQLTAPMTAARLNMAW